MNRLSIFFIVVIATLLFAAYAGLSSYRASPEGMLMYTPIERCPVMQHSFTVVYVLCLVIASIVSGLVAVIALIASTLQRFLAIKHRLHSIAMLCLVAIGAFLGASFLSGLFEAQFPLRLKPGCERHAATAPHPLPPRDAS